MSVVDHIKAKHGFLSTQHALKVWSFAEVSVQIIMISSINYMIAEEQMAR